MKFLISAVMTIKDWFYWTRHVRFIDEKKIVQKKVISLFEDVLRGFYMRLYNISPKSW